MKEIRDKLKENEKELRKSVKEGSAFNTGKLLNIVANLIEYALNTHTHASSIASELEDLQCKNEINKSLESKKTYSIDEAFKNELDIIDYNSKFVNMGFDSIDDFFNKLGNEVFVIDGKYMKENSIIAGNLYLASLINKYEKESESMKDSLCNLTDNFICDLNNIKNQFFEKSEAKNGPKNK